MMEFTIEFPDLGAPSYMVPHRSQGGVHEVVKRECLLLADRADRLVCDLGDDAEEYVSIQRLTKIGVCVDRCGPGTALSRHRQHRNSCQPGVALLGSTEFPPVHDGHP